jgi:hypothetical protein
MQLSAQKSDMQERRLSARKPKLPSKEVHFPGFNSQSESGQGRGHQARFASPLPSRCESEDNVDYSAVLQSLQNLPSDLISSAPVRRVRSHSGSEGSEGYRSDGVVDFELEVQQFEARSFNQKYCSSSLPPFPTTSRKSSQQHEECSNPLDSSTGPRRPSSNTRSVNGTSTSSCQPGSLPEAPAPSFRLDVDLPTHRSLGSANGNRLGVQLAFSCTCCH